MQVFNNSLLELLAAPSRFRVPVFQRRYGWPQHLCAQLFEDILRAGSLPERSSGEDEPNHFTGAIIYTQGTSSPSVNEKLLVDGQQRFTTIVLIVMALVRHLVAHRGGVLNDAKGNRVTTAEKLLYKYVCLPHEDEEDKYRLLLCGPDQTALRAVIENTSRDGLAAPTLFANYDYFCVKVSSLHSLETLLKGLSRLRVATIELSKQENPQEVFESFNSKGFDLAPGDLIRNFLLMGMTSAEQTKAYHTKWEPMEQLLSTPDRFERFMRAYLDIHSSDVARRDSVYTVFKSFRRADSRSNLEITDELYQHAKVYARIALGEETDPVLKAGFDAITQLKVEAAHPFILKAYIDHQAGRCSLETLRELVCLAESYSFRRTVCNLPSSSRRKVFLSVARHFDADNYLGSAHAAFAELKSSHRFPSDNEFTEALTTRDCYNFTPSRYMLNKFETHGRKEPLAMNELTIEHVLPQGGALSVEWQHALGADWQNVHPLLRHRLGNLTLTGYNSELSNRSFLDKQKTPHVGFAQSPLRLNEMMRHASCWTAVEIENRGRQLALKAVELWASPREVGAAISRVKRSGALTLHVVIGPNEVIRAANATNVFITTLEKVGLSAVRDLQLSLNEEPLVDLTRSAKYPGSSHKRGELWVNTSCGTEQKKRTLDIVFSQMNLPWTAVVESAGELVAAPEAVKLEPRAAGFGLDLTGFAVTAFPVAEPA